MSAEPNLPQQFEFDISKSGCKQSTLSKVSMRIDIFLTFLTPEFVDWHKTNKKNVLYHFQNRSRFDKWNVNKIKRYFTVHCGFNSINQGKSKNKDTTILSILLSGEK